MNEIRRLSFAYWVGFLYALAFLRWEWFPETAGGKFTALILGMCIAYLFSFVYIPYRKIEP